MRGKKIYIALTVILSIVTFSTSFNWFMVMMTILFFLFINLKLPNLLITSIIIYILFGVYFQSVELKNHSNLTNSPPTIKSISGKITSIPEIDGDKLTAIMLTNQKEKLLINYRISSEKEKDDLTFLTVGMTCELIGNLDKPPLPKNPNAFNYQKYLYDQSIHWIFHPQKISAKLCKQTSLSLKENFQLLRQKGIMYIEKHFPQETAAFVEALIYGYQDNMSEDTITSFQLLGTIHILAISGSHVLLITGFLFYIGLRLGVTRETMYIILFVFIPIYILLTGAAPSVIRAGFMAMIGLFSIKYRHIVSTLDVISIACIIMLLMNPYFLFQVGFQLSFVVSCALLLSVNSIISNQSHYFKQLLVITFIAQIIVLPLILYYFYEISLLSFLANLFFVPLFSFILLPLSIFTLFIHICLPLLGEMLIVLLSNLFDMTNQFSIFLSDFNNFTLVFGKPPIIILIAYYILIISLFVTWENRTGMMFPIICLSTIMVIHWNWYNLNPYGTVTMIDVGQGDSFLIELPYQKAVYLIDTGGTISFNIEKWRQKRNTFTVGDDILLPFLKSKGIRSMDKLIITHGDQDHMGSIKDLIENVKIKKVYFPKGFDKKGVDKDLFHYLTREDIFYEYLQRGDKWEKEGYGFYVLSPNGDEQTKNNRSIVILTKLGGLTWLFTGDLEKEGEEDLIANYPNLQVDVLKVGHHGSSTSTSTTFLNKLSPKYSLISVGEHNRFNHPDKVVIERLTKQGTHIYRTDQHGAVQYSFTKGKGTFQCQLP